MGHAMMSCYFRSPTSKDPCIVMLESCVCVSRGARSGTLAVDLEVIRCERWPAARDDGITADWTLSHNSSQGNSNIPVAKNT